MALLKTLETKIHIMCQPTEDGKFAMLGIHKGEVRYTKSGVKRVVKSYKQGLKDFPELTVKPYWRFFNTEQEALDFFKS